jgi:hypothetical protein
MAHHAGRRVAADLPQVTLGHSKGIMPASRQHDTQPIHHAPPRNANDIVRNVLEGKVCGKARGILGEGSGHLDMSF